MISDVFIDRATSRPSSRWWCPSHEGELRFLLSIQAPTERIAALLTEGVVGQWVIGIGDRKGDYVTRVPGHDAFSGKPGIPAFLSRPGASKATSAATIPTARRSWSAMPIPASPAGWSRPACRRR